jgi:hypothetical protein
MTLPASNELWYTPLPGELERLLRTTVGARAAGVPRHLDRAVPLEELEQSKEKEGRDQNEVRDGDQHGEQGNAPPFSQSAQRASPTRPTVEGDDRYRASTGNRGEAVEQQWLLPWDTILPLPHTTPRRRRSAIAA